MSSSTVFSPPPSRPSPHSWHHGHRLRIYWEDTDAGGIVFYANYLKFMERARTEWLSGLGFAQEHMRRAGQGMFVVSETQLRYLRPARLDDVLNVTVAVTERGRASVVFHQEIWRDDTLLCQGRVRIGWVEPAPGARAGDDSFKSARMPAAVAAMLPDPLSLTGD